MKVKYTPPVIGGQYRDLLNFSLTNNSVYDAIKTDNNHINVINDKGEQINIPIKVGETIWFVDVTQEERDKKIDEILNTL